MCEGENSFLNAQRFRFSPRLRLHTEGCHVFLKKKLDDKVSMGGGGGG